MLNSKAFGLVFCLSIRRISSFAPTATTATEEAIYLLLKNLKERGMMMDKDFIQQVERCLKQLGETEDRSEELVGDEAMKLFTLYENKYEDVSDDSVDICLYRDMEIEVFNEALPFSPQTEEERKYLLALFEDSSFTVDSPSQNVVSVSNKTSGFEDLSKIIKEYQRLRTKYLKKYGAITYYEQVIEDGSITLLHKRVPINE